MQMHLRKASQRGHADHGWLDTNHTFSFAGYRDPEYMGFGHLRVINEDRVAPGRGFGAHSHRNMEIISYVVAGGLEHKDSIGTGSVIRPGEVQVMSAGRGVAHSEFNASALEPVHFLQIWVLPAEGNTQPRYDQRAFDTTPRGARLVVSPDGRDGSLRVGQDMDLYRLLLDAEQSVTHAIARGRVWMQVIRGELEVNGVLLQAGDGLAIVEASEVIAKASADAEALLFDLI